jgi:hypothetical protein
MKPREKRQIEEANGALRNCETGDPICYYLTTAEYVAICTALGASEIRMKSYKDEGCKNLGKQYHAALTAIASDRRQGIRRRQAESAKKTVDKASGRP